MQTKLTLRMEAELIEQAKAYAQQHGKSLSQMVADYFTLFTRPAATSKLAPATQSLLGILQHAKADETDYKKHLEEKYL